MTLSKPVSRKLLHNRKVECFGFERDDGLWDIEGHLVDTKTYDFANRDRGSIRAGEPLHEMWLRLTLDLDLKVHDVEARTVWGPYSICGDITEDFKALVGLSIKPGWTQKTRELLGGIKGCTHLVELLGPIATTAFQTVYAARAQRSKAAGKRERPALIDSCHAWASDSPVVAKRFPEFYTGPRKTPG